MQNAKITEEQMVGLVRNALLVAGREMGAKGDHWPVINSTIYGLMKDWEELKVERNVHEELRVQLYAQLDRMDQILLTCPADIKSDAAPKLKELREIYDAYFTPPASDEIYLSEEDIPAHVLRAEAIIETLGDDNA